MTTSGEVSIICDCCGEKSEQPEVYSYSTAGSDLDLREHHLGFDPIYLYIQRCPKCGYCAYNIHKYGCEELEINNKNPNQDKLDIIKAFINTDEYQAQLKDISMHQTANKYLCTSMIYEKLGDYEMAGTSAQRGAWVCDDFKDARNADILRSRAAGLYLNHLNKSGDITVDKITFYKLITTDLYRRSGEFDKAVEILNTIDSNKLADGESKFVKVQSELIQAKNKCVRSFEDYYKFKGGDNISDSDPSSKDTLF